MVKTLQDFMCGYIQERIEPFKGYLLAAYNNKDQFLSYLDESLGTSLHSKDIRNCELLTDAGLFNDEVKLTRDGRNCYRLFYLTDLGKEMAEQITKEGFTGKMPENAQVVSP